MSNLPEKIYSLRPSWQGKYNWSQGLPNAVKHKQDTKLKNNDYWGEYVPPVWDDMFEYRKSFSNANNYDDYYHHHNHIYQNTEQTNEHQFITFSRNKKMNKKKYANNLHFKFALDNDISVDYSVIDAVSNINDLELEYAHEAGEDDVLEDFSNDVLDDILLDNIKDND